MFAVLILILIQRWDARHDRITGYVATKTGRLKKKCCKIFGSGRGNDVLFCWGGFIQMSIVFRRVLHYVKQSVLDFFLHMHETKRRPTYVFCCSPCSLFIIRAPFAALRWGITGFKVWKCNVSVSFSWFAFSPNVNLRVHLNRQNASTVGFSVCAQIWIEIT